MMQRWRLGASDACYSHVSALVQQYRITCLIRHPDGSLGFEKMLPDAQSGKVMRYCCNSSFSECALPSSKTKSWAALQDPYEPSFGTSSVSFRTGAAGGLAVAQCIPYP